VRRAFTSALALVGMLSLVACSDDEKVNGGAGGSDGAGAQGSGATNGGPRSALLTDTLSELPQQFSDIGLYRELPRLDAAAPALDYEPGFPLWSDGGEKHRSIVLPDGSEIDGTDPEAYAFPVGTLLFKTFAYKTPASPDQARPVETRLLRSTEEGWELAAYAWNEAGTDAELLDLKRGQPRDILNDAGDLVVHSIPSRLECRQCHESAESAVLGLSELQLAKSGSLSALATRIAPEPKTPYATLPEHGPLTSDVLGYLVGNCVHCHNGSNGAASSFDLRPEVARANLIGQPTASSATADGVRVVPGEPEQSVLYLAVKGGSDFEVKDMPPLGVAERDSRAIRSLEDWIIELANDDDP
jgi:hypothetical protein